MAKRPRSKVTELQQAVVGAVLTGTSVSAVASNPTLALRSATVQQEIAAARAEISDLTTLKRLDVIVGIIDGINVARMQADGGNVIRGWCEIAKILGHYAPEVKNINLNVNQQRLRSKLEALSDDELMEIMDQGRVIEHGALNG